MKIRDSLQGNITAAKLAIQKAAEQKPVLIGLPEYFTVPNCMADFTNASDISKETCKETLNFLAEISKEISNIYLLGGSVLEEEGGNYYNTSTLWRKGSLLAKYKKINPIQAEIKAGVAKGTQPVVVNTDIGQIGLLVCADTFNSDTVKLTVNMGAEIISLPVAAMGTHPIVKGHPLTQQIARDYGVFLLKVGNVCSSMRGGRSAIISPWGILGEVSDAPEDSILSRDLDMRRLREYRQILKK
ncbi:MAG TPA: carbon-nitrogen hydrolase family protein [Verrucomicrobiae bacterium]|nr:carbon-nitrogen hydrolase family protein [Verrucomicrobiae bacterium]